MIEKIDSDYESSTAGASALQSRLRSDNVVGVTYQDLLHVPTIHPWRSRRRQAFIEQLSARESPSEPAVIGANSHIDPVRSVVINLRA